MGEWHFLGRLLDKVQTHTTVIGKVWLTSLFVFRILVLGAGAEGVWGDEQSDFVCNTQQPGCERICFNHTFPISHIRFWVLQIVSVSMPTLIYLGHAVHIIHTEKKIQQKMERRAQNEHDGLIEKKAGNALKHASGRGKVCLHGSVLRSYMVSVFCKIILELGFILGQYYLYGFSFPAHHICDQSPCPHNVDCFLSRATEKTIFIWLMLVVACVSFILNLVEIIYLCVRKVRQCVDWKRAPHSLALKRKEFKDEDQALQNWVNMEPELNE